MQKKERYQKVIAWFKENVPVAESELKHRNPYELIVATILSAQCTDKRVNMVTPDFFKQYPTVYKLADADVDSIYELIKSISFPNNKAKHLLGMAQLVVSRFKGKIPSTVEELETLPGVGRKTANVVASIIYNKPVIAVDTHVFRVSARIGLSTNAKTPLETEKQLEAYIPEEYRAIAHHWLILHGRYICVARKPKCDECGLTAYCKYYATTVSKAAKK